MAGGGAAGGGQRRPVHLLGPLPRGICPEGGGEAVAGDCERGCDGGSGNAGAGERVEEDCGCGAHIGDQSGGDGGDYEDMERDVGKSLILKFNKI